MAYSFNLDTNDKWNNHSCDLCYEADDINVKAASFCDDCVQFMCNKCYKIHERLNATRGHNVKTGTYMPRSQADKPPTFSKCDDHPKHLKNQFCSVHKQLVCSSCSQLYHKKCSIVSVENVSKSISSSDTNHLYDIVSDVKRDLESSLMAIDSNIDDIKDQELRMHIQAQTLYEDIVSKAKKWLKQQNYNIDTHCQSQLSVLKENRTRVNNIVTRIESSLCQIDNLRNKSIDTKLFLRIQEILSDIKQCKNDLSTPIYRVQLSFVPSIQIQEFISSYGLDGIVKVYESNSEITIPEILLPGSSTQQLHASSANKPPAKTGNKDSASESVSLEQLKGHKLRSVNVKLPDDRGDCVIIGIAITKDGRRLLTDRDNKKVKLFSRDMKLLSSLSLSDEPCGISVLSDQKAVVTTFNATLVILHIAGRHLSTNSTISLPYSVWGNCQYGKNLVVTNFSPDNGYVQLIDTTGKVYWSTFDQRGFLFREPQYVTSNVKRGTVIVSDCGKGTLTVLKGETGVVINRRRLDKSNLGVTTGPSGNIFVCCNYTNVIDVLTEDLSEKRTFLSQKDGLGKGLCSIAYDKTCRQFIVSYVFSRDRNSVDVWELS